MDRMDRRRFLAATALGGAGVVSAAGLAGVLSSATDVEAADIDLAGQQDPNFLEGKVVSVDAASLVVLTPDLVLRRTYVTNGTQVWKVRDTTLEAVQANDHLYARGLPLQDGSFAADSIWVNIVNLHAEVVGVDASTLRFTHHGEGWTGHLQPDTVARYSMRAPSRDLSGVAAGPHVQVVGAWRPGTNEIDVSTVFA
jgi:hypothetical protein